MPLPALHGLLSAALRSSPLTVEVVLRPVSGGAFPLRAMIDGDDDEFPIEGQCVEQDVIGLQVWREDYPAQPTTDDRVDYEGAARRIGGPAAYDELTGRWSFRAARLP